MLIYSHAPEIETWRRAMGSWMKWLQRPESQPDFDPSRFPPYHLARARNPNARPAPNATERTLAT
jgi:hypothetical protein